MKKKWAPKFTRDRIIEINKVVQSSAGAGRILGVSVETYHKYCKYYDIEPVVNRKHQAGTYAQNRISKAQLEAANSQCSTGAAVERLLGISHITYVRLCERHSVKRIINRSAKGVRRPNSKQGKYPIEKMLKGEFPTMPLWRVLRRLVNNGLKKYECDVCGFNEARIDGKYPLLMFFKTRTNTPADWAIENLGVLCYNCFFLTRGKAQNKNLSDERTKVNDRTELPKGNVINPQL